MFSKEMVGGTKKNEFPTGFNYSDQVWVKIPGYDNYEICRNGYVRKILDNGDYRLLKPNNRRKDWKITTKTRYTLKNGDKVDSISLAELMYAAYNGGKIPKKSRPVFKGNTVDIDDMALVTRSADNVEPKGKRIKKTRDVTVGKKDRTAVYLLARSTTIPAPELAKMVGYSMSFIYAIRRGEYSANNIYVKPSLFGPNEVIYIDNMEKEHLVAVFSKSVDTLTVSDICILNKNVYPMTSSYDVRKLIFTVLMEARNIVQEHNAKL